MIASDAAERAVVVARALIANGEVRLTGDVLALLQAEPVAEGPAAVSGRFLWAQAARGNSRSRGRGERERLHTRKVA